MSTYKDILCTVPIFLKVYKQTPLYPCMGISMWYSGALYLTQLDKPLVLFISSSSPLSEPVNYSHLFAYTLIRERQQTKQI